MGFPTTLSMNLVRHCCRRFQRWSINAQQGMLVGWGILSPISKYAGWAPGPVGNMSTGARGWILWVSLAIMCADALVSLLPVIFSYLAELRSSWRGHKQRQQEEDMEDEPPERLVPHRWVVGGLIGSISLGTILVWLVFGNEGIKPWATLIGFVLGGLLSVMGYEHGCLSMAAHL